MANLCSQAPYYKHFLQKEKHEIDEDLMSNSYFVNACSTFMHRSMTTV